MKCYYCGAKLDYMPVCPECGENVRIWKKICAASNLLYNEGLEKAQVRDLSGAAAALKQSLKYNKANVPARNLLGLIYYETGDSVAALSEWVISRSMDDDDNPASRYISDVQKDAASLTDVDSSLKKYNQSLVYCREGNLDLAIIQMKKVVSLNPKFVKGQQLMALLYMQGGRYDLAMRCLRQAVKIDAGSTMTLRYMRVCREQLKGSAKRKNERSERKAEEEIIAYQSGNDLIIRPNKITDNSTVRTVLYLLLGAAIGVAFVCFLVIPEVRQRSNTNAAAQMVEMDQVLAVREQTIHTMEYEMDDLNQQIADAEDDVAAAGERTMAYQALLSAYQYFADEDYMEADMALTEVDRSMLEADGRELYDEMEGTIEETFLDTAYETGMSFFNEGAYDDAIEQFLDIAEPHPDYREGQAAYHLAYSYNCTGDYENAAEWFNVTLDVTTDPMLAESSQSILEEIADKLNGEEG